MNDRLFLGVDGGGTKTQFVLARGGDDVIGEARLGSCYYPEIGLDGLRDLLNGGVSEVTAAAGVATSDISCAFFGIACYGEDNATTAVIDRLAGLSLGHDRFACDNDMVCGWAGSHACADGINIVAGTGSIGYGRRGERAARAGGWGGLFADEGSAYWLALRGLNAFARMSDGRLPKGPLYARVRKAFSLQRDLDLCAKTVGNPALSRAALAQHSRLVVDAASEGDLVALGLMEQAGQELAGIADAVRIKLGFADGEPVPVSWSGGCFNAGEVLLAPFRAALNEASPAFEPRTPLHPPHIGAALFAEKLFARKWGQVTF